MKTSVIIQARMGSTRLPGKILKKMGDNDTVLSVMLDRLKYAKKVDSIIIATTRNSEDDQIVDFCKERKVTYYRGDELDVLSRFYYAANLENARNIVRLTSDCPLIDAKLLDEVIEFFLKNKVDYVSSNFNGYYPRGFDIEILSYQALKEAFLNAKDLKEREHVTPYIYNNTQFFRLGIYKEAFKYGDIRVTIDTQEDYKLVNKIYSYFVEKNHLDFSWKDVVQLLHNNKTWLKINENITQKKWEE